MTGRILFNLFCAMCGISSDEAVWANNGTNANGERIPTGDGCADCFDLRESFKM